MTATGFSHRLGTRPETCTAEDPAVLECITAGPGVYVEHDYRPFIWSPPHQKHLHPVTVLRCVWCHVLACGSALETDPCLEPMHHKGMHQTKLGVTWPRNAARPRRNVPWPPREDL